MPLIPQVENEDERLAALESYNILDTAEDHELDELTVLASAICQTPIALISMVDDKRQWLKSRKGLEVTEISKEYSFCAYAIASDDDIMIVDDATKDERFAANPLVTGKTKIVFYAGVPLVNEDGFALGSLSVIDHEQKLLTEAQTNALKIIAKQVVTKLELRKKALIIEKTNQDLRDANVFIQKFASMAAHDIKNPLSSILLTSQALKMRLQKLQDEACERLIDINISSTKRLMVMLEEMAAYSRSPSLLLEKKQAVDLTLLLRSVINLISVPDNIEIVLPVKTSQLTLSVVAFEQIFINLLTNAIRYNYEEKGIIAIRFSEDEDYYRFEVEDNGIGIAEQYHEKIFNNNFTLKITDRYKKQGSGIGLSTVRELVKALGGTIFVKSGTGEGATFFLTIKKWAYY